MLDAAYVTLALVSFALLGWRSKAASGSEDKPAS
jgi:hypothetical protein